MTIHPISSDSYSLKVLSLAMLMVIVTNIVSLLPFVLFIYTFCIAFLFLSLFYIAFSLCLAYHISIRMSISLHDVYSHIGTIYVALFLPIPLAIGAGVLFFLPHSLVTATVAAAILIIQPLVLTATVCIEYKEWPLISILLLCAIRALTVFPVIIAFCAMLLLGLLYYE